MAIKMGNQVFIQRAARRVEEEMRCSEDFQGAYNAVYNNCQSFVTLLVRGILRHEDSKEERGFREILRLRRCVYEKRRHDSWEPFWREMPGYLRAWTEVLIENAKWRFKHPGQYLIAAIDREVYKPRLLPMWDTAVELGIRRQESVEHRFVTGLRYAVFGDSDSTSIQSVPSTTSYGVVEPMRIRDITY